MQTISFKNHTPTMVELRKQKISFLFVAGIG